MSGITIPFQDFKAPYLELKAELDEAYRRFIESGWFVLGQETAAFEKEYAQFCGAAHAVGVANGLEALRLALLAADIGPGDEVIVPSNTYIATWLAVSHIGAVPVAVEPDPATFNINPGLVSAAVTGKTKAILAVNLYGQPCDYDALREQSRLHGLRLIIDNAQAHGALYKGKRVGGLADIECHSFYPSKNLGAYGEAGAITTNDPNIADRIQVLRNYGSRVRYQNEVPGYNARIDELQAAFLRVKLRKLDEWNARRAVLATQYLDLLSDCDCLYLPQVLEGTSPVWHLFVVRHPKRDALQRHMTEAGIQTLIHYPVPPHRSGAYAPAGSWRSSSELPVAEQLASEILSLPIGPHMTASQVARVCEVIRGF